MPNLPLPNGGLPLDGGDVPVTTIYDVLKVYPRDMRATGSLVRDAINAAMMVMFQKHQQQSSYAAAQSDPSRATGIYLDGFGEDHLVERRANESDEDYATRIFSVPDLVTPDTIMAGVTAITQTYSELLPQYLEAAQDRLFVFDGASAAHGFIGTSPQYTDRFYIDDASVNGGDYVQQRQPGEAWCFNDTYGRYFVIRIPPVSGVDAEHAFIYDGNAQNQAASYIGDGSNTGGTEAAGTFGSFAFQGQRTAQEIYDAITNFIALVKGQSMRWQVIVDPKLNPAYR